MALSVFDHLRSLITDAEPRSVLELGAHQGEDTRRILSILPPNSRLIAVEPDPRNVSILAKNPLIRNGHVQLIQAAVGGFNGRGRLHLSSGTTPQGKTDWWASSSIYAPKGVSRFNWLKFESTTEVDIYTLDRLHEALSLTTLDFLWADIQGGEYDMIVHGQHALKNTRFLYTEFDDAELYEGSRNFATLLPQLPGNWSIVEKYEYDVLLRNDSFGDSK